MATWLLSTIVVYAFELNVLWVLLFIVAGAYIATSSKASEKAFQLAMSRPQRPVSNQEQCNSNANLGVYCTNCGIPQPTSARFCPACGASIATTPIPQPLPMRGPMAMGIGGTANNALTPSTILPDLGTHLRATMGSHPKTMLIYTSWEMDVLSVVGPGHFCTSRIQPDNSALYCATFDFGMHALSEMLKAASPRTRDLITQSLVEDSWTTRNIRLPEPIAVGIGAVLGDSDKARDGPFVPLIIVEVFGFEHAAQTR